MNKLLIAALALLCTPAFATGYVKQGTQIVLPSGRQVAVKQLRQLGVNVRRDAQGQVRFRRQQAWNEAAAKQLHIYPTPYEHHGDIGVYSFKKLDEVEHWAGEYKSGTTHIVGVNRVVPAGQLRQRSRGDRVYLMNPGAR